MWGRVTNSLSHQDHRVPESGCFFCSSLIPLQWTGAWNGVNTSKYLLHERTDVHFPWSVFSLDATVFENKGKHYFIWAEKVGVGKQISNLYIAEMASPNELATVQVLLVTPDYDWERIGFWVCEGPSVLKKDGKIFVTYSASETGAAYCVGMLTADENADLLDPLSWKKERYPVLQTDASRTIYGPGHNSFTKDANGNDVMVYHARTEDKIE